MNQIQKDIHENAIKKSKNFKRAEFELIESLEEVERERVCLSLEYSSLCDYAVRFLDLSAEVAMTLIRVMRKGREVPALREAIQKNNLSISSARKIVPILNSTNQDFWIAEAKVSTARQLEQTLASHFPERLKRETVKTVSEEYVSITIRVKKEDFSEIKKTQDLLSKKHKRSVSMEETLVSAAKEWVHKNDPVAKAKRAKSDVTLRPSTSEKLPASALHKVNLRDEGRCQFRDVQGKACDNTRFTEIHHRVPRSKGGTHEPTNLTTLCSGHHKAVHFNL
jgi:hypothetical protein